MPLAGELHALGIDVGISGVRAAVTRADGSLAGTGRRAHQRAIRAPGIAEHDPHDWLDGLRETARRACADAGYPPIGTVGIAALGPAPLLVDRNGAALTNAPLFSLDCRAQTQRARLDPSDGRARR
jgi:sugar (pentulose or hexulose) kinase